MSTMGEKTVFFFTADWCGDADLSYSARNEAGTTIALSKWTVMPIWIRPKRVGRLRDSQLSSAGKGTGRLDLINQ